MDFPPIAFIEGLGGPEVVLILVITLLLFGGKKMPELARGLGKSIREFKKATANVEEELKRAIEEEDKRPAAPVAPYHIDNPPPAPVPAIAPAVPPPPAAPVTGSAPAAASLASSSPASPSPKPVVPPHDEHPDLHP